MDPHPFNVVGEKYIDGVVDGADAMAMMIPPLGRRLDIEELLGRVDGLLLTGSPSNIEPQHYGGNNSVPPHDPHRDATTLKLLRRAVERAIPLLAICRGCQEVNVAYGGTLHPQLDQVEGLIRHREDSTRPLDEQYAPTHKLELTDTGLLASLAGTTDVSVNSLHTQGVAKLGAGLVVEATAPDGLIEAFSVQGSAAFSLAVQWHPEWKVAENPFYLAIFRAFGTACRQRMSGAI
ncbi:MAG TPA: gamma-glutamyl-gamma-aminobutyrate hydrolase family protein [Gammaproteobacteria bacterium]|nr:gamma-glutamyl-gamma-aminobutyrate hydrolase family protein [Gammaproteobacteria bacterium]HIO34699.1 gamma-glutamyl-gamma-aminobutyrate hydrolase family protein [Gammaproteobacteria bacterium]